VRLAPAGVVLVLALVSVAAYAVTSGWFDSTGSIRQATPTRPTAVTTSTPSMLAEAPVERSLTTPLTPAELSEQLARAWGLAVQSEFEEAIRLYQDLVQRHPDDARPEVGWAWALIYDRQADQALEHARRAVELDPLDAETMGVLARAYIETGDRERAVGMAEGAVQLDGSNTLARAILAEAYLVDGQLQNAEDEAHLALTQEPGNAEAHRIRGWLYHLADDDASRAAAEFQVAADLQPDLWVRHYELGLLLLEAEDYDAGVVALKRALELRPKAIAYTALGDAYYHLGQYDRARSFLQQALSAGASDADTYALLAASDAQQDRCDDATTYLEQALNQDPAHPLALAVQNICQGTSEAPTRAPTRPLSPPSALTGWIAFPAWNADREQYDTYVSRADGSDRHLVVEEMHQPAFSPDGLWLAVNGERPNHMNLFLVRPDGSGLREITEYIEDSLPCWSPDGGSLVFSSSRHRDRQSRVYVIDEVPFEGNRAQGRPLTSDLYEVLGQYPAWTHNGRIVYAGCDYTATPNLCGLFLIPDGPGPQIPTQLTADASDTAPAAYDHQIAFMSNRDGNWEIYLVNDDGSGLKRLTSNTANDGLPAWAPDGKTVAFVSDEGGVWAVWAMNPDGSDRRKLFGIGGGGLSEGWQLERIGWGPQ
jgi:TolB protein